jgi:predicted nuclease of predicted toxin-antitoxin system
MTLHDFALLTDENLDPEVVEYLRHDGFDVLDVREAGLAGNSDVTVLRRATLMHRVVITQDSDFGTLAIASGEPITDIVFLRPGHI